MNVDSFIDPKEIEIESPRDKKTRKYIISCLPYFEDGKDLALGAREFESQYLSTGAPKIGDYNKNSEIAKRMFKYVAVVLPEGQKIPLVTTQLINAHVPDFMTGMKIEGAMLEHNLGFSLPEKISGLLETLMKVVDQSATKILTGLQAQSLTVEKPRSKNSKRSTASGTR